MDCKFCNREYGIYHERNGYSLIRHEFCPMCGTLLAESEPLTPEQLKQMDGEPVWIREFEEWAIVIVDSVGRYDGVPFVKGKQFNYDIGMHRLMCYTHKPQNPTSTKERREMNG